MRIVWILLMVGELLCGMQVDLVVYGSTPAGIAAAVVAARQGHRVVLIEPTEHFGGMLTGGLSYTDFRTQEAVTGFFREYMDRVKNYYAQRYGKDSAQVKDSFLGALAEPHVSTLVLRGMVAEQKTLEVKMGWRVERVESEGRQVRKAVMVAREGRQEVEAKSWIDATYEGDLAAVAKVPFRVGRESTREYGERLAGVIFFDQGRILPGSSGEGDDSVQCANLRITMTDDPALRVMVERPASYRREEFAHLAPLFQTGKVKQVYSEDHGGILRLQRLPNRKADMNDIKQAPIRLALPGEMQDWPGGDVATRRRIYERHRDYALGLLYFLQNDAELPAEIRAKAREWGLARDEFSSTGHVPPVLYVREARRIEGRYVFSEHDTQMTRASVRATWHADAIAIGDYTLNSHGHHKQGPVYPQLVEGDFAFGTMPFQIPLRAIQPRNLDNLLVPVALSASHVGYSAVRLEPTWTALGHAAGLAAHLNLREGSIAIAKLQRMLHEQGQATTYVSDVAAGDAMFRVVQWAGVMGLWHDVEDRNQAVVEPLKKRFGLQYSFAFGLHAARLGEKLEERVAEAWRTRLPCAAGVKGETRGEFIEAAYRQCEGRQR